MRGTRCGGTKDSQEQEEEREKGKEKAYVERVFFAFGDEFKKKTVNLEATMEKIVSIETTTSEMFAAMRKMTAIVERVEQRQEEAAQRQEINLQQLRDEISSLKRAGARVL